MQYIRRRINDGIKAIYEKRKEYRRNIDLVSPSRLVIQCIKAMVVAFVIALLVPNISMYWVTSNLVVQQDAWLLIIFIALTSIMFVHPSSVPRELRFRYQHLLFVAVALAVFCYLGHRLLLMGYNLSRDEQMADFDAAIFANGHIVWPLPGNWQRDAAALNLEFMLPISQPIAWVSAYLPMNAALRAAASLIGDPALTGPSLAAGSMLLIWSIARHIWPDDREAPTVAVMMLLGSGQFVLMGMTAYAMPAHLFFNLLWLRLFLGDRRLFDGFAILVGLVATGLHQPLFHPMFVAPFLLLMLANRQWLRLAAYTASYGVIGLFWLSWPIVIHNLVSGPASVIAGPGTDYLSRLLQAFSLTVANPTLTAANLLRFCTWQHLLLLPLMVVGFRTIGKNRFAGTVALSFTLPILVMAIILPYQGIGIGYRYLHGVLGNAVLLAVIGWRELIKQHEELRAVALRATMVSLLILLPIQAWMTHARYESFAHASAQIDRSGADYFLVQATAGPLTHDLVLNRPDLSNRPLRIGVEDVDDISALAKRICGSGASVAFGDDAFYAPTWAYFGSKAQNLASRNVAKLKASFDHAGCRTRFLS